MPSPVVSVVMPAYNAAPAIGVAVRSILDQEYRALELVVVDDGSTDATVVHALQSAGGDPRLVLVQRPHAGIVAALNAGLASASGAVIARMDTDDWSHPRRLSAQLEYLDRHPEVDLVACGVAYGGDAARGRGYAAHVAWINGLQTHADISIHRFIESPFAHPSVCFRRVLLGALGGYDDGEFPEDYELWLRWLEAGIVTAKIPETLLVWNDPPGRLSRCDQRYATRAFYRVKASYLARWLRAHNPRHPEVVVWGAGRETRKRAELLVAEGVVITAYVDIDAKKIGRVVHGRPVLSMDELPPPGSCFVVPFVASRGARDANRCWLETRGYVLGRDFILAA